MKFLFFSASSLLFPLSFAFVMTQRKDTAFRPLYSSSENEKGPVGKQTDHFLEQKAIDGANKIRSLSIEERTRRAMLAEAAEDRMITLSDELDSLLGDDGMPIKENREEAVNLATEIKAQQEQYRQLVMGEQNNLLDLTMNSEDESFE